MTVNGAYGVVFHLKNPQATWPNILTTGAGQIVDHSLYPAKKILPNTSQQVGTGPYMLSTFTPGQQVVLKPNPYFWGPKPANGGVIINYYSKSSTMKLALEKGEIDMAFETFTPTELVLMEDLGFSARGHAWKDVLDGAFDLDGDLPVNPDGGLKSFGHPIGASGLRMLFECWLQLRGEAPQERRIRTVAEGRSLGLTHNLGGAPGQCVSFVSVVGAHPG